MKKIQIHKVIFTVFLFAIGFTMLTPLLWMISTSFKPGKRSISVSYQMDSGTQCRTCQL